MKRVIAVKCLEVVTLLNDNDFLVNLKHQLF